MNFVISKKKDKNLTGKLDIQNFMYPQNCLFPKYKKIIALKYLRNQV